MDRLLDRHQTRRRAGIPTVSVLVGPVPGAREAWRRWLSRSGRSGVESPATDALDLAAAWARYLLSRRDVLRDIASRHGGMNAAGRHPRDVVDALVDALTGTQGLERQAAMDTLVAAGLGPGLIELAEVLAALGRSRAPGRREAPIGRTVRILTDGAERVIDLGALAPAMAEAAPYDELPGLLIAVQQDGDEPPGMWPALAAAVALAERAPAVAVAVAVGERLRDHRDPANERSDHRLARVAAVVREGIVELDSGAQSAGESAGRSDAQPVSSGVAPDVLSDGELARSLARLTAIDAPEPMIASLMASFAHAAQLRRALPGALQLRSDRARDDRDSTPAGHDHVAPRPSRGMESGESAVDGERARSAAERVLFDALQTHPGTRGRFTLNRRLDFLFGRSAIEVDLVCEDLNLAVEIDGYWHFHDSDAYRRDRRKDLLLQQHGYLVVRFLADDVIIALDRVLDTLLGVVAGIAADISDNGKSS